MLAYGPARLVDSTFIGNTSLDDGGGAWVGGLLTLTRSRFERNRTTLNQGSGGGGGLIAYGPSLISGTQFISNTTADWGGGAYLYNGTTKLTSAITNAVFISNTAVNGGGGGMFSWFTTTLKIPWFSDNFAGYRGGGLYSGYAGSYPQNILGGRFLDNSARGGGGLYSDSSFTVSGVDFSSNTSRSGNGGGAWTAQSARVTAATFMNNSVITGGNSGGLDAAAHLWLTDTLFASNRTLRGSGGGSGSGGSTSALRGEYRLNQALDDGGGMVAYGTAVMTQTLLYSNTTGDLGGGVAANFLKASAALFQGNQAGSGGGSFAQQDYTLVNSNFRRNLAVYSGGGLLQSNGGSLGQVSGSTFQGNQAGVAGSGGGLYSTANALTLQDTTFDGNSAGDRGGGLLAAQLTSPGGVRFFNNTAGSRGGGLMLTGGTNDLTRILFTGNQAAAGGGLALEGAAAGSLKNSLLARNQASGGAGQALYKDGAGAFTLQYTTIASPTLASGSAVYLNAGSLSLQNSILAQHTFGLVRIAGSAVLDNPLFFGNTTNTQGAGITVNGAVSGNPAFFAPALDDYHLGTGSLAFNAGLALSAGNDIDGDPRPQGGGYDIGYDEAITPSGLSILSTAPQPAGFPVQLTAVASFGQGVTFSWNFGDGHTAVGKVVSHAYAQPGSYLVTSLPPTLLGRTLPR